MLSPSFVMLSAVKQLAFPLRINSAKYLRVARMGAFTDITLKEVKMFGVPFNLFLSCLITAILKLPTSNPS